MDKKQLQDLLNQPYSQKNWLKIVQFVFPNVSILATPKEYSVNNDKIKSFRQLGNVRLHDGKNLALFELLLSDAVNIQRNRVELNQEISKYIDQYQIHGVLSVFEQGTEDYRFTFSARSTEFNEQESDFVFKKTDTKRFTYVLGKNESCKTPAERFFALSGQKDSAGINTIQNAFSVEQLSKEFFEKYKKQFDKFWRYIDSNEKFSSISFGRDDREKGIRDFVKKLLGRIVFLHFLQKKGWMGCTSGVNEWKGGDKRFLQTLFNSYSNKENFHSKCLGDLFYETLNKKRDGDIFSCDGLNSTLNLSKVPYLNGGLFDSDETITRQIDFPDIFFQELFDFFAQYNFTIDESDPDDHEVGIDPEMLGHIFENLLEDNKDKGAFYTPKVIVQYMCQESIIEYLNSKVNSSESVEIRNSIEELIYNRLSKSCNNLNLVALISRALYDVKICDPAIGSGAFPMGILNVIYQTVEELYFCNAQQVANVWGISSNQWQPHIVKKNIIQRSIYGVDIESGAVDIARLRFWLALIVDEIEPMPLPNLDYKIMQGNSLLESFEGIDLSQIGDASAYEEVYENMQIDLFSGEAKKTVKISLIYEDVKTLIDAYFNESDPQIKKDIHARIDEQVINHIRFTIHSQKQILLSNKKRIEKSLKEKEGLTNNWEQKEKIRTSSQLAKELLKTQNEILKFEGKENSLSRLSSLNERPFFLWHLFFKEVFDNGGFDIVIANPPYISVRTLQFDVNLKQYFKQNFLLATGQYDLYVLFIELTNSILKKNGIMTFIIPQRMLSNESFEAARRFVMKNIPILCYVEAFMPFENANVEANIMLGKKAGKNEIVKSYQYIPQLKRFNFLCDVLVDNIERMPFYIFPFVFNTQTLNILFKIQSQKLSILSDFVDITRGFECGYSDESITEEITPYKLIKATCVQSYITVERDLLYCRPDFNNSSKFKNQSVFKNLPKLLTKFTASKIEFSLDTIGYFNTNSVYNVQMKSDSNISHFYLLGLLNSKLITFWFNTAFMNRDSLFPHIQKNQLDAIPIKLSEENVEVIENLVKNILEQLNSGNEVGVLQNLLDATVFEIYGIDEREMELINIS